MIINEEQRKEFERLSRSLALFLRNNFHPHVSVIVDCNRAEIFEGNASALFEYSSTAKK